MTIKAILIILIFAGPMFPMAGASTQSNPIQHVVVIVQENHTFDNYFGAYPGVNGIQNDPSSVHPILLAGPSSANLCHSTACARLAYDNGKMDNFITAEGSNATFGYYDQRSLPYYWSLAQNYTLFDNYFTSEMGPSLPNHLYLVAGQDANVADGITAQYQRTHITENVTTIANRLEKANVSWAYYSPYNVGNEDALGLVPSITGNGTMLAHLKYTDQFLTDLKGGKLPAVSYLMTADMQNEHPPADVSIGQAWVKSEISAIQASPYWNSTVILLTWDDYGGWYDHVSPPQLDSHGLGFRVPLLMISPLAKTGYVDHTLSDHVSLMKFIETVFNIPSITQRDFAASDLMEALNVNHTGSKYSLVLQNTPVYSNSIPSLNFSMAQTKIWFSYLNTKNVPQSLVFYAVLRNHFNQTLQIDRVKAVILKGATIQISFAFAHEPAGKYSISVIALGCMGTSVAGPLHFLVTSSG